MEARQIHFTEVDILLQEEFNAREKQVITRILEILGICMVLETSQLFEIYQHEFDEKLKLKYLKLAVREKLIVEYKKNYQHKTEENQYFYELKKSGI